MKNQEASTTGQDLHSATPPATQSRVGQFFREFAESNVAVAGLAGVVIVVFVGLFASVISPTNPYDIGHVSILDSLLKPGEAMADGQIAFLGTDGSGRDMLSAILYGLRISLFVGIGSGVIAAIVGVSLGVIAAYFGGRVETVFMRIVDIQLSFPTILVALILLAIFGKGIDKIIAALVIVQWAYYARTVRASAMIERRKEYVEAARCLALPRSRVIFGHILPNCLAPIIVIGTTQIAHAISLEATLSFLGLGLPVTAPSLGLLISNGFEYVMTGRYWISVYPGLALLFTIASINLVGDRLRDVLNPRLKR